MGERQMDDIRVSVIIPVYNAEKYLNQCLDSVVNQTLNEIEIICIDDGSTDNSLEILSYYEDKDPRFKLLKQNNKYAGTARNVGINNATGEYLVFWDADDYFYPEALEKMLHKIISDKADICICGGRQYYEDLNIESPAPRYIRKKEIPGKIPFNIKTHPDHVLSITVEAAWNKMFRKEFIINNNIHFKEIRNANDVFFVESSLCLAESITIVNEPLIYYRKNKKDGLVTEVSKGLLTAFETWVETAVFLKNNNIFPERSFANRCLESIIYLLNNTNDWSAYKQGFQYLQDGNLEILGIRFDVDDDYYYIKWQKEAAKRLYENTPEEYAKWIGTVMYLKEASSVGEKRLILEKQKVLDTEIKTLKQNISDIKKENEALIAEKKALQDELNKAALSIKKIKNSKSYKVGNMLALPIRLLRGK